MHPLRLVILVIREVAAGVPELEDGGIIHIFAIADGVLHEVGQIFLEKLIIARVKVDAEAGESVIDQRFGRGSAGLALRIHDEVFDVKRLLCRRRNAGGDIRFQRCFVDELELIRLDETAVSVLGDDIVKILIHAENAGRVIALLRENRALQIRRLHHGAARDDHHRIAGDVAERKLAVACVLFEHIARRVRKSGAHLVHELAFGRGDFAQHDQVTDGSVGRAVDQLRTLAGCIRRGEELDRSRKRNKLQGFDVGQQVIAHALTQVIHRLRCGFRRGARCRLRRARKRHHMRRRGRRRRGRCLCLLAARATREQERNGSARSECKIEG